MKGTRRNNSPQAASLVANPETRAGPGPPKAGQGLVRNLKSPWNAVKPPNHQAGQSRFSQRCRASHTLVGPCWRYTRRLEPSPESLSLSGAAFPPFVSISERPLHCIPLHPIPSLGQSGDARSVPSAIVREHEKRQTGRERQKQRKKRLETAAAAPRATTHSTDHPPPFLLLFISFFDTSALSCLRDTDTGRSFGSTTLFLVFGAVCAQRRKGVSATQGRDVRIALFHPVLPSGGSLPFLCNPLLLTWTSPLLQPRCRPPAHFPPQTLPSLGASSVATRQGKNARLSLFFFFFFLAQSLSCQV